MNFRITVGSAMLRFGNFVRSLAVAVMRPRDLIEFGRRTYAKNANIASWACAEVADSGLHDAERDLLRKIPRRQGRLLLLGVGGGREAIPLARVGFAMTGLDFVADMVAAAKENARRHGVAMDGLVQELSRLDLAEKTYEVVWLSAAMYSCIPTRRKRMAMLRNIHAALKPGGYFVCQFHWDTEAGRGKFAERARKAFAILTLGNFRYEAGDTLWFHGEFVHAFSSLENLRSEFTGAGFEVLDLGLSGKSRGGAILRKNG